MKWRLRLTRDRGQQEVAMVRHLLPADMGLHLQRAVMELLRQRVGMGLLLRQEATVHQKRAVMELRPRQAQAAMVHLRQEATVSKTETY
jgi:hypothetical protein